MMLPSPCPPGIFLSTIRAFKKGIVYLCTIFTFPVNWVQISKSGRGRPIRMPRPQSSGFKKLTIRPFKWDIVCFCTILGSLKNIFQYVSFFQSNKECSHVWAATRYIGTEILWEDCDLTEEYDTYYNHTCNTLEDLKEYNCKYYRQALI